MTKGMADDVANVIIQAVSRGWSRGQISGVVGVSKRAITRLNTNMRKHGTPKAPPSGAKLGRPAKLTNAQAQAMLSWMLERNYTFYIKDVVLYLRERHGFQGCHGTVRRGLLKAGFKRKLPWHKSEITTWIPPDHLPDLDVETSVGDLPVQDLPDEVDSMLDQDVAPLLNSSIPAVTPLSEDVLAKGTFSNVEPQRHLPAMPNNSLETSLHAFLDPILLKPGLLSSTHDSSPIDKLQSVLVMDTAAQIQCPNPVELAAQVLTLQQEVLRQQELIMQLRRQLTALQGRDVEITPQLVPINTPHEPVAEYSSPYPSMPGAGEM